MSKVFTLALIVTAMMIVLGIFGFINIQDSAILQAVNFNDPSNIQFGELFRSFFNVFSIFGALTGIVVGYLVTRDPESAIIAGATTLIGTWIITDLVKVISITNANIPVEFSWVATVIKFIMTLLIVGLIISIIAWWRGSD